MSKENGVFLKGKQTFILRLYVQSRNLQENFDIDSRILEIAHIGEYRMIYQGPDFLPLV
jgi:hypothetical protein